MHKNKYNIQLLTMSYGQLWNTRLGSIIQLLFMNFIQLYMLF